MPALCTTRRKMPFRMSWRNVVCAATDGHHIPWSASVGREVVPQSHYTAGALEDSMLRPRRWWRLVRTSPLLSSRAGVQGRVSSQAEVGRQAQLSRRARAPPLHAVGIVGLVERVETGLGLVPCKDTLGPGDVAQVLGVPKVTSFSSGFKRSAASLCRACH
jgi:hypothetical protein